MKKVFCLLVFLQMLAFNVWAGEDIILVVVENHEPPFSNQNEVPVGVDINNSVVGVHFKGDFVANVVITGNEGTVFSRQVNAAAEQSMYVDLGDKAEGMYNISIQDADGNEVTGDFVNEKE